MSKCMHIVTLLTWISNPDTRPAITEEQTKPNYINSHSPTGIYFTDSIKTKGKAKLSRI